jgi:Putative Actinobacterial Holin-X, holin superfamily III
MASREKETGELSIPGLVRQLADETTTLVRQELDLARAEAARAAEAVVTLAKQELQLAKAEMKEKGRKAGPGIGMVGAAAGVGLLAAGAFTACVILVLDEVMATWLAALLVGLVYAAVAGALFLMGKARVQEAGPFVPEQTIETVKEDIEWAKTQVGSESR